MYQSVICGALLQFQGRSSIEQTKTTSEIRIMKLLCCATMRWVFYRDNLFFPAVRDGASDRMIWRRRSRDRELAERYVHCWKKFLLCYFYIISHITALHPNSVQTSFRIKQKCFVFHNIYHRFLDKKLSTSYITDKTVQLGCCYLWHRQNTSKLWFYWLEVLKLVIKCWHCKTLTI